MSDKKITGGRTKQFERNTSLENLLKEVNSNLWPSESLLLKSQRYNFEYPAILIMGPLRSGTTLFMQWLANTGLVCYPTNLLSRFYQAPIIGAKIQQLLTGQEYNFRDELGEFSHQTEYKSENGKTKGALAPNEFWYFWRRFLAEPSRDVWTDEELLRTMDFETVKAEIAGIMRVFNKPFAAKGMLFNYNISFLDSILDKALFIQIERNPVDNIASVLKARERQLGSTKKWYSFKIPEYQALKSLDPISQVAGQVQYINKAVTNGLFDVKPERKLHVQYEDFCQNPKKIFDQLTQKIGQSKLHYAGVSSFKSSPRNSDIKYSDIELALSNYKD